MSDEFEDYDFSEFTADELAAMDAAVAVARGHSGPAASAATRGSPYDRFRSWKKSFAVTDLVSPLWCEVQYEYALYGKRYKPLPERPAAFTSKSGKQIHVHQEISRANDRTLRRGKSIHQALEDELRPDKVTVQTVSDEERFGLRLVQLIDGFNELVANGITRELPVFVITHDQVIIGIIDEVLCTTPGTQVNTSFLPKKKQRRSSLSTQQQQPDPNSSSGQHPTHEVLVSEPDDSYELQIIDYKTRRAPNIPSDHDSLSPRLQLMMYHRMLSSVLHPEAFDFTLLWNRLKLNPRKSFSPTFLNGIGWERRQTGPADFKVHLDRLVAEWKSTVQRQKPAFTGVNQHMQLVYRRSVDAGKHRVKGKPRMADVVDRDDPLETLLLQELDLARAIEASLGEMGCQEASQVANQVTHNVKEVGPSPIGQTSAVWQDLISSSNSSQADPALAWAIQQSLLSCARKACDQIPAGEAETKLDDELKSDEQGQKQAGVDISPIIGVKRVEMNDEELDTHMADVLQWWLGLRSARGVDIALTNRCFTCEYQNSCEWREQKAKEAVAQVAMTRAGVKME